MKVFLLSDLRYRIYKRCTASNFSAWLPPPRPASAWPTGFRRTAISWSARCSTISGRPSRCCLFAHVAPLGVAWLRIASAAVIFALWRRPWRYWRGLPARERRIVIALGLVLAAMNCCFYEAIARLPLGTVGAIEFLGPIGLAAFGLRTPRNLAALVAAAAGVTLLTDVRIAGEPLGFLFAFANCALFVRLHRARASHRGRRRQRRDRPARRRDADRGDRLISDRDSGCAARAHRSAAARRRDRGRRVVVGHSLHLRPARDGAVAARDLRADARAAAGDRITDRLDRVAPGAGTDRGRRYRSGHRRCCASIAPRPDVTRRALFPSG